MGELNMYRQLGIRPNFTEIGRKYGLDRRTVAKYWRNGDEVEDHRRDKASAFDEFRDVIEQKASLPGVTKRAIYEFLLHRHPDAGLPKYGSFTKYCRNRGIECAPTAEADAHPRFETPTVFKEGNFYALSALAGTVFFVVCSVLSAPLALSSAGCVVIAFGLTVASRHFNWRTKPREK